MMVGFAQDDADALGGEPDGVSDHVGWDTGLEGVADGGVSCHSCCVGGGEADVERGACCGEVVEGFASVHLRIIFTHD